MTYVDPSIKEKFETLPTELKNTILEQDVELNTIYDLMDVLQKIIDDAKSEEAKA